MSSTNSASQGKILAPEHPSTIIADGKEIPASYGPPGSSMDIATRAHYLIVALDSMSQRNIRDGFPVAAFTKPHDSAIWARYTYDTEEVLAGADINRRGFEEYIRRSFWKATGFTALKKSGVLATRDSGLMPERQIVPRARIMWRDFNKAYGHPDDLKARNKYKKQLDKSFERVMVIKEQGLGKNVAA